MAYTSLTFRMHAKAHLNASWEVFLIYYLSIVVALIATVSDYKSRKITNKYIIFCYLTGTLFRILCFIGKGNVSHITDGLTGMIIPYVILLPVYALRIIGAADVKLLSVLGLLIGAYSVCLLIIYSFITGGVMGIFYITVFKRKKDYEMPFAVAIFLALIIITAKENISF